MGVLENDKQLAEWSQNFELLKREGGKRLEPLTLLLVRKEIPSIKTDAISDLQRQLQVGVMDV